MPEDGRTRSRRYETNRNRDHTGTKTMLKHLHLRRLERTLAQTAAGRGMGVSFHTEGRIWVSKTKWARTQDCDPREVLGL